MHELNAHIRFDGQGLTLGDFCEAAVSCKSLELHVLEDVEGPLELSALAVLAGKLVKLSIVGEDEDDNGSLGDLRSLACLSHLTALEIRKEDLMVGDPFAALAELGSLQDLSLVVGAYADPLTTLSSDQAVCPTVIQSV